MSWSQSLGVQSLDLIITQHDQKIGTEKKENKRPSCKDRQNQSLIELYLIIHCPVHLCCFPPLSKCPWSWLLNSAHLAYNIQIEIRRRTKLNLSWHFLHSKFPLSCDALLSFSMNKKKLFSIIKHGFSFLPVSIQLNPTEVSLMEQ